MLLSSYLKSYMLGFSVMWTKNFQMSKLCLKKTEEPESKLSTFSGSQRKQENSRKNIYLYFIDYNKAFDCGDHNKLWKALEQMGIPDHLTCFLRNLYVGQEASFRNLYGKTDSRLKKEYNRDVCCHSAWLTYTLSTLWEMPGWMNYKWE